MENNMVEMQTVVLGIVSILTVAVITILVAAGMIKEKYYPYCIAGMAVGLVYSTTMLGTYVVGSDIQGEVYASRYALTNGWDIIKTPVPSIVPGIIAPGLSILLHMNIIWVYKTILPLALVGVPVVLYYAFRKQIGDKRAFFATLFFIIMPVYSLEITQITKSMFAELFFALMILAMVSKWRWQYKGIAVTICVLSAIVCHYTIGLAMLCYLFGIFLIRLATNWSKWKAFALKRVPIVLIPAILIIGSSSFYTFHHYATGGVINDTVGHVATKYLGGLYRIVRGEESFIPTAENQLNLNEQTPLVKMAVGLDFLEQPVEGKVFRIVQFATQLLIIVGSLSLLLRPQRYKFTAEFIAGIGCSFILILCCIFIQRFGALINMTRFYQISLFFLAPMIVVGCDTISKIRVSR
jgi:uncharacterized membrane protein